MRRREFIALLGAAAAWPLAAVAQPAKSYRIAFLALTSGEDATLMPPLLARLHELGYREGQNMAFVYRSAEGKAERLEPLARALLEDNPHVLIAGFGTLAAKVAKAATTTIPVVFVTVGDPVGAGIVASLNRPGGNVTGLTDQARDVEGKRLQLLLELVPGKRDVAVLLNPDTPFSRLALAEANAAAEQAHVNLRVLEARTAEEVVAQMGEVTGTTAAGLMVFEDPVIYSVRATVAALATRARLPAIYAYKDSAEAGGLMAYAPDRAQIYRRAAEYVDKILQGTKPSDLAVEQPARFTFVVNLKAARAIGIEVPATLLATADEVIE